MHLDGAVHMHTSLEDKGRGPGNCGLQDAYSVCDASQNAMPCRLQCLTTVMSLRWWSFIQIRP